MTYSRESAQTISTQMSKAQPLHICYLQRATGTSVLGFALCSCDSSVAPHQLPCQNLKTEGRARRGSGTVLASFCMCAPFSPDPRPTILTVTKCPCISYLSCFSLGRLLIAACRSENLTKGEMALKHAAGLGVQPSVVPVTDPVLDGPLRPVEVGWHPVGGLAGKWFAEDTGLGKMITEKIHKYPDPTQHWAVLVGDFAHQLWMVRFEGWEIGPASLTENPVLGREFRCHLYQREGQSRGMAHFQGGRDTLQ